VKLASRSQKSESAAEPLANVSATRDGDIRPGSTAVNVTGATPVSRASERAASTSAAARWRFFFLCGRAAS
jgi:hypothetical protein